LCNNLCGILQILVGLDSNKGIRDFILTHAFNGSSEAVRQEAGAGRLYNEEAYSKKYGNLITSTVELIIEVAKSLDAVDNPERAEAVLQKICRCIISAAGPGCGDDGGRGYTTQQVQQFYAMVVDWIQFIHFDRDCRKFADDKCECCPAPPSVEQWLEQRCKLGTGNGQCVVCTGACSKYRRSDDFKPMLSSLLAIKHYVGLLTVSRDGNYQSAVSKIYQDIVSDYSGLYGSGEVTFYPDCAAPQFCCSATALTLTKVKDDEQCSVRCKPGAAVSPLPIPEMDTRKVYQECQDTGSGEIPAGGLTPDIYNPNYCFDSQNTNCRVSNPCVVLPDPNPVVQCNPDCCDYHPHDGC